MINTIQLNELVNNMLAAKVANGQPKAAIGNSNIGWSLYLNLAAQLS